MSEPIENELAHAMEIITDKPPTEPDSIIMAIYNSWIAERTAPELLPSKDAQVDAVMGQIRQQVELIEREMEEGKNNIGLVILQTEIERIRYILRSYLRTRLYKIDKFPIHYTRNAQYKAYMTNSEQAYLRRHIQISSMHLDASFLRLFPAKLQRLDDSAGGLNMVDEPDLATFVFCRVIEDCGDITLGNEDISLKKDMIFLIGYEYIRQFVLDGRVRMI